MSAYRRPKLSAAEADHRGLVFLTHQDYCNLVQARDGRMLKMFLLGVLVGQGLSVGTVCLGMLARLAGWL